MEPVVEIRALLQQFQEGYTRRDLSAVDAFMELFTPDCDVIGTNGYRPGQEEWYLDCASARELVEGDWRGWGDVRLHLAAATIKVKENVGWVAVPATVSTRIGEEGYENYLQFMKEYLDKPDLSAEQKLLFLLRGGTNTVFELRQGEHFVWPLRLTAVVVHEGESWRFAQMNFSFPTAYFPDVRLLDEKQDVH